MKLNLFYLSANHFKISKVKSGSNFVFLLPCFVTTELNNNSSHRPLSLMQICSILFGQGRMKTSDSAIRRSGLNVCRPYCLLIQLAIYLSLTFHKKHTSQGCSKAGNMISDLTIVVTKARKTTLGLLTIGAGRESQLRAWILFHNLAHTCAFHKWFS